MDTKRISGAGVTRLSLYLRELNRLEREGAAFVSSHALAQSLNLTDAQIRRDLNYFGQFGRSGRGYEVRRLQEIIPDILGLKGRTWRVAVIGVGNLGSALLGYRGFRERGFVMTAAYDADPRKVGKTIAGVKVESNDQLESSLQQHRIHIGIIAVPVAEAQGICERLINAGIKAILNFAPIRLGANSGIMLRNVDLSIELESLAYHLSSLNGRRPIKRVSRPSTYFARASTGSALALSEAQPSRRARTSTRLGTRPDRSATVLWRRVRGARSGRVSRAG